MAKRLIQHLRALGCIFVANSPTWQADFQIYLVPREIIQPQKGDKRYARRDEQDQFTENQVQAGKSLRPAS
jgi:hypothetical protein